MRSLPSSNPKIGFISLGDRLRLTTTESRKAIALFELGLVKAIAQSPLLELAVAIASEISE